MKDSKNSEDLYRPIIKEGTHLAQSRKTPGAYRGTQLSDANNQVDGQTEWIKVDKSELGYDLGLPYNYKEFRAEVELTEEQRELAAMIGEAIAAGAFWAFSKVVAPRVKNWWQEKAVPSIKKVWQELSDKKSPQNGIAERQLRATQLMQARAAVPNLFTQELDEAYEKYAGDMTSEEAQRELLDIFVLSAVVVAKMRKLANARIKYKGDTSDTYIEGKAVVERLSAPQFVKSINMILERNPQLLEETAAPLAEILGCTLVVDGRFAPIGSNALKAAFALNGEV